MNKKVGNWPTQRPMHRIPFFNTTPRFGGRGGVRVWVWYYVKLIYIRYNLFAGTDMLSLSVYEPIAKQILLGGPSPNLGGRGRVRGSSVVPRECPGIICLMKPKRYLASFRCYMHCKFWGWGKRPPNWGEGWGYGVENGYIRKFNVGFLLAPHSDQSAISNRFHRNQQRYRQTDRQTDRQTVYCEGADSQPWWRGRGATLATNTEG